jgi:hypothetical protein
VPSTATKAKKPKRSSKPKAPKTLCAALTHPLRTRILEVVNETPMSPSQFVEAGLVPEEMYEHPQQALSLVSHHFRKLHKEGCLTVIEEHKRRGAVESVFTGCTRVFFSDEDFAKMSLKQRLELSKTSFQGLVARTEGAIRSGTFDSRTDRHLTWRAAMVDFEGWEEIRSIFEDAYYRAEAARVAAVERMADKSHDDDGPVFPITFAQLAFESPPLDSRYKQEGETAASS